MVGMGVGCVGVIMVVMMIVRMVHNLKWAL